MDYKPLQTTLQAILPNQSKPRIEFLAIFITALFQAGSVNLSKLSRFINPKVEKPSNERRCTRFLDIPISQEVIAKIILTLIGFYSSTEKVVLAMDRTNWKFGVCNINFLVISISFHGFAIPLVWVDLEKQGNSNAKERKALLLCLLKLIPANRILGFTADREFIGKDWFATLLETGVNPVIRIKSDTKIQHRTLVAPARVWFHTLKPDQVLELSKARVYGIRVFVVGVLTSEGELLLLVTQKRPSKSLRLYACRWQIECLFRALKSSGFNVEDTHLTSKIRLEALLGVLAIGVVWSVLTGVLANTIKPTQPKEHGRLAISIFKRGFETLVQILVFGESKYIVKNDALRLLSGT